MCLKWITPNAPPMASFVNVIQIFDDWNMLEGQDSQP